MALIPTSVSKPFLYLFGRKMRFFASFCTSGIDIQEITLTFRLQRNLGGTSEMLKQVWHFTRFALNLPFRYGGTKRKVR